MSFETAHVRTDDDLEVEVLVCWTMDRPGHHAGPAYDWGYPSLREAILRGPDGEEWALSSKELKAIGIDWD